LKAIRGYIESKNGISLLKTSNDVDFAGKCLFLFLMHSIYHNANYIKLRNTVKYRRHYGEMLRQRSFTRTHTRVRALHFLHFIFHLPLFCSKLGDNQRYKRVEDAWKMFKMRGRCINIPQKP